ncbi:MAG: hypothetical protein QXQ40_01840 [Candidatus Aenigmatarchaeota archaeon]
MPSQKTIAIVFVILLTLIGIGIYGLFGTSMHLEYIHSFFSNLTSNPLIAKTNFSAELEKTSIQISPKHPVLIHISTEEPYVIEMQDSSMNIPYKDVTIEDFSGKIYVNKTFSLVGEFYSIHLEDMNLTRKSGKMNINNISFSSIEIKDLQIDKLNFENASGLLKVPEIEIRIESKPIEIIGLKGNLTFSRNGLMLTGICHQIKVEKNIVVSG